ncbi:MAG: CoF synthetase [Desulfobacteraceae bacterium 4572_35.1]|nr:MAG: CoF synthetase [Desulfobacteraceae bacterium 4572_35.1]
MKTDTGVSKNISDVESPQIVARQSLLLRQHVEYLLTNSTFYQQMFERQKLSAGDIRCYDDLQKIPLTAKADLENNEEQFLAVANEDIADICLTSGTTGKAVTFYQSSADLDRLATNEQFAFQLAGITCKDRVLIAAAIDRCFMAGMAYFLGLQKIGATTIRSGSSSLGVVAQMVQRFRPTALVGVPTFFLALAEYLESNGVCAAECGVQRLICIGEPVRSVDFSLSALGQRLQQLWQSQLYGTYASTEMATTFCDCEYGRGGHIDPELMLVEILDEQGQRVPIGEAGEVVATPLQVTGMPLLRFRTGDIACMHEEVCVCGRGGIRLSPIMGRKDQMLKYRGTTVYPPAIFAVLQQIDAVVNYYIEVFDKYELSDRIRVVVGCREHVDETVMFANQISERIAATIRVKPEVVIEKVETVRRKITQEDKRKPVLFFDYRN